MSCLILSAEQVLEGKIRRKLRIVISFYSLIAIMLGRLRMTVDECIAVYTHLFRTVFEKQKHKIPISLGRNFGNLQGRFDSAILRCNTGDSR